MPHRGRMKNPKPIWGGREVKYLGYVGAELINIWKEWEIPLFTQFLNVYFDNNTFSSKCTSHMDIEKGIRVKNRLDKLFLSEKSQRKSFFAFSHAREP